MSQQDREQLAAFIAVIGIVAGFVLLLRWMG
jgi:hypothetical protein